MQKDPAKVKKNNFPFSQYFVDSNLKILSGEDMASNSVDNVLNQ